MSQLTSKIEREQEKQLARPAKVLKTAHIPGQRRRPKFEAPMEMSDDALIEDDLCLGELPELVQFDGIPQSDFENPMQFGDVDTNRVTVADTEEIVISDETAEPQAVAVSEEISVYSVSDEPQPDLDEVSK